MYLYGHNIQAFLIQNLGPSGSYGSSFEISDYLVDMGSLEWAVDSELTKVIPKNVSFTLFDGSNDEIWTFIKSSLASPGAVFAPWLLVLVDGVKRFLGNVNMEQISRDESASSLSVRLTASDWSSTLSKINLDGPEWARPLPAIATARSGSLAVSGKSPSKYLLYMTSSTPWLGLGANRSEVYFTDISWLTLGDELTCDGISGTFKVLSVNPDKNSVVLEGFSWPAPTENPSVLRANPAMVYAMNFTRQASQWSRTNIYTVTAGLIKGNNPQYAAVLDTISELVPGDKVTLVPKNNPQKTGTYTIQDLDCELSTAIFVEEISVDLEVGDGFVLSEDSKLELVFEDIKDLIRRACFIAPVDFSRFTPPTLPVACHSWSAFKPDGLFSAGSDMQATLTGVEIKGPGGQGWAGSPEAGWAKSSWQNKATWTSQLTSAPSALMPVDYTRTRNTRRRNRNYSHLTNLIRKVFNPLEDTYIDLSADNIPNSLECFDYSSMRRYYVPSITSAGNVSFQCHSWNGAWNSVTLPNSGFTGAPLEMQPFPAVPSVLGSGASLIVLDNDGYLRVLFGNRPIAPVMVPENDGCLVQTPYGVYLVNHTGYGKITLNGNALKMDWVSAISDSRIGLLPQTFVALDAENLFCFSNTTVFKDDGKATFEMGLLQLDPNPAGGNGILSYDRICSGFPAQTVCIKDPGANRLIGLVGGRLFQISSEMSTVIERIKPSDLNALDLIEDVCRCQNAVAISMPEGFIGIVSRNQENIPNNVLLDVVQETELAQSEYFFSYFQVGGLGDLTFETYGSIVGQGDFSITQNPLITTDSQCRAICLSYANFFGKYRRQKQVNAVYTGGGIPPWESFRPMQRITLNNDPTVWYITSVKYDPIKSEAEVKFLQAI